MGDTLDYNSKDQVDRGTLAVGEIEDWIADLEALDATDETFFNLTQYCYVVEKSA